MIKKLSVLLLIFFIFIILLIIFKKKQIESFYFLNEKQSKFKKTLEDMKKILDSNNVKFFLYCGTALGAHREKKFIEHDHDIDIGVLGTEFNKIKHVMKNYKSIFYLVHYFPKNSGINSKTWMQAIIHLHPKKFK